jgi:cytochrome c oxidase cbb3-type subunit 2
MHFIAPPDLEKYITKVDDPILKLTSKLLLLRKPVKTESTSTNFNGYAKAQELRATLQKAWEEKHPDWREKDLVKPDFAILELFDPQQKDAFAVAPPDSLLENWVDKNFQILDEERMQPWHSPTGVIYVHNPREYRISSYKFSNSEGWKFDPNGDPIANLEELQSHALGFRSRKQLISYGERLFATEGCWYCHTDQTRTLVQDVVSNGSESFPAPPSSANEYIYQEISFPGTRRIGPDISRVGPKRTRDWHKALFWSPKTESRGTIMPAFQHFFDFDPRGTGKSESRIPNYKFEAIFQYLLTKGTRITPPTEAWWLGKDPIDTKAIIEGRKVIK